LNVGQRGELSALQIRPHPDLIAALTLNDPPSYIRLHADVAELADAQVSEACDGDIVEVQVLSSAPVLISKNSRSTAGPGCPGTRFFLDYTVNSLLREDCGPTKALFATTKDATEPKPVVSS